ncbi:MAG: cyclic nucleotide-binding domain-containing protein [Pseudomonadota bacterium]
MTTARKQIDGTLLKDLVPLNSLNRPALEQLLRHAKEHILPAGHTLFERGDATRTTLYLLEGDVVLTSPLSADERIRADTETARYPLAHHLPRTVTARALTTVRLLLINADVADILAHAAPEHAAADDQDIWKTKWLQSPLFRHMPRADIDVLVRRMEEIPVQAGQLIIHQDGNADCYYVIKKGRCSVSRRPAPRARDVKLAELCEGQGFGEEALITDATRNASITMIEDGTLLRLSKDDFIELLANPLLRHMPFDEATTRPATVLVDVRSPEEFETDGLIGSLNMPMPVLRLKANRFDPRQSYVVYSNTGNFSTAAAFLLLQQGLDAYVLKGGLNSVPRHRMKRAVNHYREAGDAAHANQEERSVLTFPDGDHSKSSPRTHADPAGEETRPVNFAWVSEEALWRNTIGLRDDRQLDSLFTPSDMYLNQAQDNSVQGFEEVRLFTSVGNLKSAKLSLASNDDDSAPVHIAFGGQDGSGSGQPAAKRNFSFNPAGLRKALHTAAAPRMRMALGHRLGLAAMALLLLSVGFLMAYWSNDQVRATVSSVPAWIKQQRDMDAKLTRLLNTLEKLPNLNQTQIVNQTAADAVTAAPSAPAAGAALAKHAKP